MEKDFNQSEAEWKALLTGLDVSTSLGVDFAKPQAGVKPVAYHTQALSLPDALSLTWAGFAHQHGLETNTILQGVWALLLSRYSGEEDVIFGVQIASPAPPASDRNPLPLRIQVSPDTPLLPWLQELQRQWTSLYAQLSMSLAEVHEGSEMPTGMPLVESLLVLGSSQQDNLEAYACPLTVTVETEPCFVLQVQYDRHRFDDATMTRMLGHLQTLLKSITADPYRPLAALPLLTQAERYQLLTQGSSTQLDHPQANCIHQLFEQQVEQTPDAIAVVYEAQALTYRKLNQRANQVAWYLQQLGVKPESLVGLYVDRSLEMVVGILAILKAGGAYVPLDPAYPHDRLTYTLTDAEISIILTQKSLVADLPTQNATTVCLDAVDDAIAQQSLENPISGVTAQNLIYVIYTSGSTGNPKGVLVNHHNVVRLFAATQPWYHFNQQDVVTLFHSYAFDFSVWELWSALLYGGRLVVVPALIARSPQDFYELLCQERITVLSQTPSAFRQLMRVEDSTPNPGELALRLVIFGGEALELQSLRPWFERHGDRTPQLVNMYGITETTVHVTYRPLTMADLDSRASAIGCPIPDLDVYVLDQHRQLVPIGVVGELYVGGAGVVRGYLNRPALTAERFIVNPFTDSGASKLYKTGDLARYLPNGDLEYLGRTDHQVKIRGFRIELGEIEAALVKHTAVRECIVLSREDQPDTQRLVAYFVSKPERQPTAWELSAFLKDTLPNYMLPAAFVQMDCLPLTVNGKVDRKALPAPDRQRPALEQAYIAPQTSVEKQLASLWCDLLGLDQVGGLDNFFELGGTSLLGMQMIAQMPQWGWELRAVKLYQYPTIRALAQHLTQTEKQPHLESVQIRAQRQRAAQGSSGHRPRSPRRA